MIAFDLVAVGGQVVGHPGDDLGLVEGGVGDLPGDAERLEDRLDPLLLLHAVGGAGHLDRHPDEVARLHQPLVDQVLRPVAAEDHVVAADIGVEAGGRVGGVEVDDRDVGLVRLLGDLDQAARVGARGGDAVGAGGDGGAHRLLLRGDVAVVERGVDRVAGVLGPLLGAARK